MSRNPFRQARDRNEEVTATTVAGADSLFGEGTPASAPSSTEPLTIPKKKKKKVVIKTPPRSPEDQPRKPSLDRPPSSPYPVDLLALKRDDGEDTDSTATADSDLEQAIVNSRRNLAGSEPVQHPATPTSSIQAPANPFARTLASSEERYLSEAQAEEPQDQAIDKGSKPVLDVDTFKDILLNGIKRPAKNVVKEPDRTQVDDQGFADRFPDIAPGVVSDTVSATEPLSSSDDDDESPEDPTQPRSGVLGSVTQLQRQRSNGPEVVSFASFDKELSDGSGNLPAISTETEVDSIDGAALDKPLPSLPRKTSADDAAMPPPPPTRRQGGQTNHHRSNSVISRSSMQSDTSASAMAAAEPSNAKAPPPPPSRRPGQARHSQIFIAPDNLSLPDKQPMSPPPAPVSRRTPSKATSPSIHRTPSSNSRSSLQALSESPAPMQASHGAPKPPPPRRKAESNRSSVDGVSPSQHVMEQDNRAASIGLGDNETRNEITTDKILSDLAALQREVDELRAKAGS